MTRAVRAQQAYKRKVIPQMLFYTQEAKLETTLDCNQGLVIAQLKMGTHDNVSIM